MQEKYIKDLAIALGVIVLIVLGARDYYLYNKINVVPAQSIYSTIALDASLLNQIQQIEDSIRERKDFKFTVNRDPLKQDLVVQTKLDLMKEWEEMVKRMMRLTATFKDSQGNQKAMIAFGGKENVVGVGDVLNNKKITNITLDKVYFTEGGNQGHLTLQPIPPRPAQIDPKQSAERSYNW